MSTTAAKIIYGKIGKRTCLRCNKQFNSTGPGNRICGDCTQANKSAVYGPISRGEKRCHGEVLCMVKE